MKYLSTKELFQQINTARAAGMRSIAYLPFGCIEQHGPFLPLETDSLIAENITLDLHDHLAGFASCYVFPTVSYTPTQSNTGFCGTVSVSNDTFRSYIKDTCLSIMHSPFDALIMICGHSGIEPSLREIGYWMVNDQYRGPAADIKPVLVVSIFEECRELESVFQQKAGRHADWREFLLLYYILGDDFFTEEKMNAMKKFQSQHTFDYCDTHIFGTPMEHRSTHGVIGQPLPALSAPLHILSSKLWMIVLENIANKIKSELSAFWHLKSTGTAE